MLRRYTMLYNAIHVWWILVVGTKTVVSNVVGKQDQQVNKRLSITRAIMATHDTVEMRNPAPSWHRYIFHTRQLVQDVFHQHYFHDYIVAWPLDQRSLEPAFCMNQPQMMMKSLDHIFPTKNVSHENLTVTASNLKFAGRIVWNSKVRTFGLQNDWHHPCLIGIIKGTWGGTKSEKGTNLRSTNLELQDEPYLPYVIPT